MRKASTVYRGLAEPMLVAGAEQSLLVINVGIAMFMVTSFRGWGFFWIPVAWLIHQALKAMCARDPFVRKIYTVYHRQADRYEPWPDTKPVRGHRPPGFGKGIAG